MVAEPSAQERVTAKATPAEAMACTKADSRVAVERAERVWVGLHRYAEGERRRGSRNSGRGGCVEKVHRAQPLCLQPGL